MPQSLAEHFWRPVSPFVIQVKRGRNPIVSDPPRAAPDKYPPLSPNVYVLIILWGDNGGY